MPAKAEEVKETVQAELFESLSRLQANEAYSDLKIVCGSKEFKVHKAVVCSRSEYFHAACSSGFREGEEGVIRLKAAIDAEEHGGAVELDDPVAIQHLVAYLYRLDYPNASNKNTPTLTLHAKVFAAATKYRVSGLQALSDLKFRNMLKSMNHEDADQLTDLAQAIKLVWSTTPDTVTELRNAVTASILSHRTLLDSVIVSEAVRSIDGLLLELLRKATGRIAQHGGPSCSLHGSENRERCMGCGFLQPACYGCKYPSMVSKTCAVCGLRDWETGTKDSFSV